MDFFSNDNILIVAGDDGKRSKKGDGINSILSLCQEMRNFMDKVESCAEAQDINENRQKIEALADDMNKHLEALIDVAKGGILSIRKRPEEGLEGLEVAPEGPTSIGPSAPSLPTSPTMR